MILFSILFSMLFLLEVVHRTTISRTFHKAGLNREAANHMKCYLGVSPKACWRLIKHVENSYLV